MRSLYVRIVSIFILITMTSGLLALLLANVYYLANLRDYHEKKMLFIAEEIKALYLLTPELQIEDYLSHIANMGFQIYAVNDQGKETFFGAPFKHTAIEWNNIQLVLDGATYQGRQEENQLLKITGYFENSIRNSIGLPLKIRGETYAVFIRPNLEQQIGEVRILLAILLGYAFLFSLFLIIILTRFIVKPLKKLTKATNKIVDGDFNIELDVKRKDEIGNLARHFSTMAQSLNRIDEMRQEFVANVSHEIQSPLTSIQGFSQAIMNKETTPEEESKYLQIIHHESKRLSSMSKQLLTLATLDKETTVLKKSAYRLDEQIRQLLIQLELQWNEKQLTIEPILSNVIITADAQLLYQVWLNLITNAIKFSRHSGTIYIEMQVQQGVIVKIRDMGVGIREAELPHIFERFYRSDEARNQTRSGSGLGLAIAYKVIKLHQGSIEVESELGKGTTFTVRLPI